MLAAEPPIDSAMAMCIEAWDDLQSERPLGFGVAGYIPFTAIGDWADREGLDAELFKLLKHVLRRLDRDRATKEAAKAEAEKRKAEARRGRRR